MSNRWDYIPKKDSELVTWSANFTAAVAANAQAWDVPAGEVTALQTAGASFAALYAQTGSPAKNSVIVAEKNAARKTLTAKIRELAGFRLKNPVITGAQRITLGLHVRDITPSRIPAPGSRPELDIDAVDFRRLKIVFHDMNSTSKAKPYGVNGAVIIYSVLGASPAGPGALTRSVPATRTPHILEFTGKERKTVYAAVCRQNKKGEKGPWSEIKSAIVP